MPLIHQEKIDPHTEMYLWKTEEPLSKLQKISLSEASKIKLKQLKYLQDQKNFLAVRHILFEKGYEDSVLKYKKNGQPYLSDENYISISHSFDKVAVVFSKLPVGLDVEKKRKKLLTVKDKFIEKERAYLSSQNILKQLLIIWCIKESLYKLYGIKGVSLKKNMEVLPFRLEENCVFVKIAHPKISQKHKAKIGFIENFCWAVCKM